MSYSSPAQTPVPSPRLKVAIFPVLAMIFAGNTTSATLFATRAHIFLESDEITASLAPPPETAAEIFSELLPSPLTTKSAVSRIAPVVESTIFATAPNLIIRTSVDSPSPAKTRLRL